MVLVPLVLDNRNFAGCTPNFGWTRILIGIGVVAVAK